MASPYYFETTFYRSQGDEDAHFAWLSRIPSVSDMRGEGNRLFLHIDEGAITASDLQELQAVYRRYDGDLTQLDGLVAAITETE